MNATQTGAAEPKKIEARFASGGKAFGGAT